ncbi:MAG: LacI family DNA-binding transcriptional regulator [Aggregatilineales bacterium]
MTRHHKQFGIITNNPEGVFQRAVIAGAREVAAAQGYRVIVYASNDEPRYATKMVPAYHNLAGVLAIANAATDGLLSELHQTGMPISLVSHRIPGTPIPVVMSNNAQGIGELVKHLVMSCGRRELAFLRGLTDQNDAREREAAFRRELLRYNLRVPESRFVRGDFSAEVAAEGIGELIAHGERFDGLIASDYIMAITAVQTLRTAGISIPGDVSVVGFGDGPEAEAAGLTTVAAAITELGACAARQLIAQINGLRISGMTTLSVRLAIRETCGCLPRSNTSGK